MLTRNAALRWRRENWALPPFISSLLSSLLSSSYIFQSPGPTPRLRFRYFELLLHHFERRREGLDARELGPEIAAGWWPDVLDQLPLEGMPEDILRDRGAILVLGCCGHTRANRRKERKRAA